MTNYLETIVIAVLVSMMVIISVEITNDWRGNDIHHLREEYKQDMNQLVRDINKANDLQNDSIQKLCGAIEGCEYGD